MERLTFRNTPNGKAYLIRGLDAKWSSMPNYDVLSNGIQKLAEYEDLEEQGRLVILSVEDIHPCKSCNKGWGHMTSNGCVMCYDDCEILKKYNKKYSK